MSIRTYNDGLADATVDIEDMPRQTALQLVECIEVFSGGYYPEVVAFRNTLRSALEQEHTIWNL